MDALRRIEWIGHHMMVATLRCVELVRSSWLVEQGWQLVGVSGHSSASIVEGDSVIVDEPYSVTYHFYRK